MGRGRVQAECDQDTNDECVCQARKGWVQPICFAFLEPKSTISRAVQLQRFLPGKASLMWVFSTGRYSMRHLWIAAKTCFLAHSLTLLLTCWLARSTDFTYPLSSSLFSHQVYLPTWPWEFSLGFVTLGTAAVFGAWYQIHEVAASTACSEHPVSVSV